MMRPCVPCGRVRSPRSWCWRSFSANQRPPEARERRTDVQGDEDERESKLDDAFVYDVVTRFNESLLENIDAIDTAVTAVLAGDVAIAVFAIDKIRELHRAEEYWAIGLLFGSVLVMPLSYASASPSARAERDGVKLRPFVADVIIRYDAAFSNAIETVMRACELNLTVRFSKRALVLAAMIFLLAGVVVVALARLGGNVVRSPLCDRYGGGPAAGFLTNSRSSPTEFWRPGTGSSRWGPGRAPGRPIITPLDGCPGGRSRCRRPSRATTNADLGGMVSPVTSAAANTVSVRAFDCSMHAREHARPVFLAAGAPVRRAFASLWQAMRPCTTEMIHNG